MGRRDKDGGNKVSYYKDAGEIQESLLGYMSNEYNKEKGSWLWELMKAVSCALSDFTAELDNAAEKLYVEKLQGDELDDYVANWSYTKRKAMTQANGYATFTAKSGRVGKIAQGTYIASPRCNYITSEDCEITESGGSVTVAVVAADYGSIGNAEAGEINKLITSVDFIESVTNYDAVSGGEDEESDDELRDRYNTAIKKAANAGNIAYYEELAVSVEGVGEAYCVPCPGNSPGSADLYVVNADGGEVVESAVEAVQNIVDPNRNGDGAGAAPVGAFVTVKKPEIMRVNITVSPVYYTGYNKERTEAEMRERITEYLKTCFTEKILRYKKIGQCVLECEGIKDFTELKVNGEENNIEMRESIYIFTLGELTVE